MPQIGTLTDFTANTTAVSSQVDANFSEIKTKVNTYGAWLDSASQTFTGNQTINPSSGVALTVTDGGITVTAGGVTVSADGITVTGNSTITGTLGGLTGLTVASGGITVTAGNLTMSSGQAIGKRVDDGDSGTALTMNFNLGNIHKTRLTGNCTFTFSNPQTGASYFVELLQDATGSRTVTWPATVKWGGGGTAPTLTTTAGRKDCFVFFYNGTNYMGVPFDLNFVDTV